MIKFIVPIVALGVAVYHSFPLIQVVGDSMYPTYLNSEIIFGTKFFRKSKLKIGDVIVYKSPREDRIVIKRIAYISADSRFVYCLGDNADHSYDSRHYGNVPSKRIVCKVINQRRKEDYELTNNLCD